MFSFQCPAIAFIPKHLCWARQQKDALFVKYKERHCGFRAEGSHEVAQLEGNAAGIPLWSHPGSAGWTPPTKLPCPRQGYHAEISVSPNVSLPPPGFLERAKEHNGEFYTSPPLQHLSPARLPVCPSPQERGELNTGTKEGKKEWVPGSCSQIINDRLNKPTYTY